jgi:hypothetical protein
MCESVLLGYWQRVHVGAQANGTFTITPRDYPHNAGTTYTTVNCNTPLGKLCGNDLRRSLFIKG